MGAQSSSSTLPLFSKMTNLAFADASEEDKLKVLVNQSLYDSMSYNMKVGPGLPANYSCFRCGNTGHHIRNCPSSGDKSTEAPLRIKKSTGIPRSFMVEVDDPSIKGAMLTNCGHYAIPAIHAKAYAVGKKEKPPFAPQELPESKDEDPVPKELLCLICKEMLTDAVVIPCCGNSFCDDCIRTALLDSDQHTCPTCKQSSVSPDTLIANKFLRQAVNTFQKEQGQSKSSTGSDGTSQSVNPAWAPDPVLKKKPHQSAPKQQPQEPQSTAQGGLAPPLTTGPTPPPTVTTAPLQQLQTQTNTFKNEPAEQACEKAAAAEPHEEGSVADAASAVAAVSVSTCEETPQTVSITPQQSAPDPLPRPSWPPAYWESASSSSSGPPFSSSSATYPTVPPPLFPSPRFPGFLAAQHHLVGYPPGYPAASPVWSLQPPQGPPIPPLCSSTHDWYKHQREKNETRSPHRGSAHRRSSSRSRSSKSSHSYSRSSSRSRSRSRSVSRSRHHSPYSRSRQLHTHSHSSYTHSYGHKRSPTPSSSSSPRLSRHSRSKSPSDHRKKSHHSRHHGKKTSSGSRSSSGRRGEGGQGGRGSEDSHASAKPNSSMELDRQRYLQWKRDYQEWCDKYLSSYISHFNQPPPLLNLPPSPRRLREDTEGDGCGSRAEAESRSRRGGSAARANDRSTPSRSSSDCCSTASQSSIDSRSSPSRSSNHSRSPASHMSSDGYSTPSKPRAADHTEDGRKDARRHPRSYKDDPPGLEKTSSRESVQLSVKGSEHLKFRRERREHNNSEKDKRQASKGSGKTHSGKSKSDSRSEKPGKRKGEDASAGTRRSKSLKTSPSEVCRSEPQRPSDKKGSGKEKKSQPVSERNIWEEGMMVKPQKRISINISLDARKKEEKHGQTPQSSAGKPGGDVQKSDNGGEEKANEMELSGAPGGEAKEEIDPDEREQSPIWKKDVSDHQDQVTEEGQKKEGWHCIFPHDEEEEDSERMKASGNKEVTTGGGRSTQKEERGGRQEKTEFFTADNVSVETESRVEVKLRTEAKEDGTRSLSEQDRAEGEEAGRHGSHGNGVDRMLVAGAPKENSKERITQVPGAKWEEEESAKKEQEEEFKAESSLWSVSKMEKSTFSGSHCGTASSSGIDRFHSSSSWRDWKREKEMEKDRTRQQETEGKQAQERRKKEEKHRDGEEEESERNLRDEQGEIQGRQLHQCYDRLPAPSDKAKDKAAGNQQSPPPLRPHSWGEERGPPPSEGTQKSENDVMVGKKAWMEKSPDNVIKVCRLQGDGVKKAL